jgi:hypothetical protein
MHRTTALILTVLVGTPLTVRAGSFTVFTPTPAAPTPYANVVSVSDDGQTVAGPNWIWTPDLGLRGLAFLPNFPVETNGLFVQDISADGRVLVGQTTSGVFTGIAWRWSEADGFQTLATGGAISVSADGTVVAGTRAVSPSVLEPFRWTEDTGPLALLPQLPNALQIGASIISKDGAAVFGTLRVDSGKENIFRHTATAGVVDIGRPSGWDHAQPRDASSDGSVVVVFAAGVTGNQFAEAVFRWTEATGFTEIVGIGGIPKSSANGNIIVGENNRIWDPTHGVQDLEDVILDRGIDLGGYQIYAVKNISADGRFIVGEAYREIIGGNFNLHPFLLDLGAPVPEPAGYALAVLALLAFRHKAATGGRARGGGV